MQIVIDGLLTHCELVGTGKLVLLLHGWGDSSRGVAAIQKDLSKKYQVLALDLPGFGATQPPKEAWDLDNYAQFLQSALKKLNLDQPYAVIGHSNGGALAVRAVSLGNLKPDKMILLAASGVRTGQSAKRTLFKAVAKIGNIATFWLPNRYRQALRKRLYGAAGSDALVVPQLQETFKLTVRQDVQADAAKISIPTLLIYAADDEAVPVSDGKTYNKLIKSSQLQVIPDAGHFVHLDQTQKVNNLIQEFLK